LFIARNLFLLLPAQPNATLSILRHSRSIWFENARR